MKLGGTNFKEKHFQNHFLWFSCQKKQFCCIIETYFSTNASFRLVETNFMACTNHFLYVFRDYCWRKFFFLSSGNVFVNEPFIPAIGEGFFSLVEHVTSFERFFLLVKTDVMSEDQFLNTELILAGGNWFSAQRKPFVFMVPYTFQGVLYRNKHKTHFSVQKNSIIFYSELSFLLVKIIVLFITLIITVL